MMSRTFHAKIPLSSWALLTLLILTTGYAAWRKEAPLLVLSLVVTTLLIEQIIHTEYVLQDGKLQIRKGRFSKPHEIEVAEIQSIDQASGMRIGGKALTTFLVIVLKGGKEVTVTPKDETGFIQQIHKQRYRNEHE